jgi:hypothetical protein
MKRHVRTSYYVVGEGELAFDREGSAVRVVVPSSAQLRPFRFSRLGPRGAKASPALMQILAEAMTGVADQPTDETVPAGFTYLGQFVDHDLTADRTERALGSDVRVDELVQGRSPALDLDALYGHGPDVDRHLYQHDQVSLRVGTTAAIAAAAGTDVNRDGFDLPRVGIGATKAEERAPLIPDARNDENLAVAQTHVAFIRFHNRVVEELSGEPVPSGRLFERARAEVVRHYQWVLRHDYLPRIVDPEIVEDVFGGGRTCFEAGAADEHPTMPIEFSVAAFRLGHSMVREAYAWNRVFPDPDSATLAMLFTFSGVAGNFTFTEDLAELDDPDSGTFLRLPTSWILDWRRMYDFDLADGPAVNRAKRIDTLLVDPLRVLPAGTFDGRRQHLAADALQRNLAFRNLVRANMVELASGQQLADRLDVAQARRLTPEQILIGKGDGAVLGDGVLDDTLREELLARTPLWFYVLREAELDGGRLGPVGGRIVAEVFHRAMEASVHSIVRDPQWRPWLGRRGELFEMTDLLAFAFDGQINPLGEG